MMPRNIVDRVLQSQGVQGRVSDHNSNQQQQPKFCLPGSFAVNHVLAMEAAKAAAEAAKAKAASTSTSTTVVKPVAAPQEPAEKSTAKPTSKAPPGVVVPAVTATPNNNKVVQPLKNLKIMSSILGGKQPPKKTTRIQISMKKPGSSNNNNNNNNSNNNKGATTPTPVTVSAANSKTITPVVPPASTASAKSVSSLSSLDSKSASSQTPSPTTTSANTITMEATSPRRVSIVSASSSSSSSSSSGPSVSSSSTSSTTKKSTKSLSKSPLRKKKNGRSKVEKKKNVSASASVSTTSTSASTSTSSSKAKEGLVPSPYDLTFCAEDDFVLFQTVDKKIREIGSPIRLLVEAIAASSLLYSLAWMTNGEIHETKFDPETLDPEAIVLGLNKKLFAKPDTAVLHRLSKDLNLTAMVKAVVKKHGFEKDYPKIASRDSRLLVQKKMTNLKCLLFLARFHCATMYCNNFAKVEMDMDPNLLYVVQKCLSIVEGYADVTPKKKRGRKKKAENDTVAVVTVEGKAETTETGHARRVSVLEGEKEESQPVAPTGGDAVVATICPPNEEKAEKKKKKQTKRRLVEEDKDGDHASALPLKKRRVAVSVDSFPALRDLVETEVANGPEVQKHLVELEKYFTTALQMVQRRQQALALYENNCS